MKSGSALYTRMRTSTPTHVRTHILFYLVCRWKYCYIMPQNFIVSLRHIRIS